MTNEFLAGFRALHEQAKRGELTPRDRNEYEAGRSELARAVGVARRVALHPGQTWRSTLRVPHGIQVEIQLPKGQLRTVTTELSVEGMTVVGCTVVGTGTPVGVTLHLPGGELVNARGRIAISKPKAVRFSVLLELAPEDHERLEMVIYDAVLATVRAHVPVTAPTR
jgi:hypothetical protein